MPRGGRWDYSPAILRDLPHLPHLTWSVQSSALSLHRAGSRRRRRMSRGLNGAGSRASCLMFTRAEMWTKTIQSILCATMLRR